MQQMRATDEPDRSSQEPLFSAEGLGVLRLQKEEAEISE
jgi:hypothetical protein